MNKDKIKAIRIGVAVTVAILFVIFYPKLPFRINVQIEKDSSESKSESVMDESGNNKVAESSQEGLIDNISANEKGNAVGLAHITKSISERRGCRLGAITGTGSGIVIFGNNGYSYSSIPEALSNEIKKLNSDGEKINSIAITASGYYCVVFGHNGWYGKVPENMRKKLNKFNQDQEEIKSVSISEKGDYAIVTDKHFLASNIDDHNYMQKAQKYYGYVKSVCITDNAICVVCDKGVYYHNIKEKLIARLKEIEFLPDRVVFTDYDTFLITTEGGNYTYHM